MKITIMQIAVVAALGAASPRALATHEEQGAKHAVERRAAAQARSTDEVLASWTGALPRAASGAMAVGSGGRADRTGPDPLASWTGSIPSARVDGQGARSGADGLRAARSPGAVRVLASWSGSISSE